MSKIAAIRLRGTVGKPVNINRTLELLHLHRKNYCSIYDDNPSTRGMLKLVKDYVTYGEVKDDTVKLVLSKKRI